MCVCVWLDSQWASSTTPLGEGGMKAGHAQPKLVHVSTMKTSSSSVLEPVDDEFIPAGRTQSTMNIPVKPPRRKTREGSILGNLLAKKKEQATKKPEAAATSERKPAFPDLDSGLNHAQGLTTEQWTNLIGEFGYNEVVAEKESFFWKVLKMYLQPINLLVLIAAILSVAIAPEPIANPLISTVPETLVVPQRGWLAFGLLIIMMNLFVWSDYFAEKNAGDAVSVLKGKLQPVATAKRDGAWKEVAVRDLVPGDVITLVGGSMVPADVQIMEIAGDHLEIDESALTGESLPAKKYAGDESLSGGILKVGEAEAVVLRTGKDSFFGKTISLLGSVTEQGHLHTLLMKLTYALTGLGALFSIGFMILLLVRESYYNSFPYIYLGPGTSIAMSFGLLSAAMPLAIPVITGAILAVGAKELADIDVVVARMSCLEELAGVSILCSDKTGTLTLNQLKMEENPWIPDPQFQPKDLYTYAALASSWVRMDAIDLCIMNALNERTGFGPAELEKEWKVHKSTPFNAVTKRTEAEVTQLSSKTRMLVSKGAPHVIQEICHGGEEMTEVTNQNAKRGFRTLGVCVKIISHAGQEVPEAEQHWVFVGYFALFDPPRVDSKKVLAVATAMGLHVKMITGDAIAIAEETMARLGLGRKAVHRDALKNAKNHVELLELIESTNGFAGVYPEDKFAIVEGFQLAGHKVAMTGDGVNDAPALRKANVGVAVDGATDAAKAAADIVILTPGLSGIVTALTRARKIFQRLDAYLIFRIAVSLTVMVFFFLAAAAMHFIVPTYVIVLVALINDCIMLSMSYDYVTPSPVPVEWDVNKVIVVSTMLSLFGVGQNLLFIYLARPAPAGIAWWTSFAAPSITENQVISAVFLCLNVSIQLSVFSARTEGPFWTRRPGKWLVIAIGLGILVSSLISGLWTIQASLDLGDGALMDGLHDAKVVLLIYLYCIFWFLATEVFKVVTYIVWDRIQFGADAHVAHFFTIAGYGKRAKFIGDMIGEEVPLQPLTKE